MKTDEKYATDPTENVKELVKAEIRHVKELIKVNNKHAEQLRKAEAKRIDAIRAVDISTVTNTATSLALQLSQMAETFRKNISDLEKAQYESRGSSGGIKNMWGWIIGGLMALVAIGGFLIPHLK